MRGSGCPNTGALIPKDGDYHGAKLAGEQLVNGVYRPIELTTEPDGILKGYSPVLGLSVCWQARLPRLYDPPTNTYLESWRDVAAARSSAEARATVEQAARLVAEERIRQLEAELRPPRRERVAPPRPGAAPIIPAFAGIYSPSLSLRDGEGPGVRPPHPHPVHPCSRLPASPCAPHHPSGIFGSA